MPVHDLTGILNKCAASGIRTHRTHLATFEDKAHVKLGLWSDLYKFFVLFFAAGLSKDARVAIELVRTLNAHSWIVHHAKRN